MAEDFVIEMLHITKEFPGIKANDDITLQLRKGEVHALLGENGAGKSTLMSVLFGLYQGAFACAVFAQQGMDLTFAQLQGNVVVCLDARELLGDMEHLDHKILCQSAHSPFVSKRHLYYCNAHYTVFLLFCTLLFENLVFCHIISITFVHFDEHSFLVLKKHTKKAGRPLQSVPPGKTLITGCS